MIDTRAGIPPPGRNAYCAATLLSTPASGPHGDVQDRRSTHARHEPSGRIEHRSPSLERGFSAEASEPFIPDSHPGSAAVARQRNSQGRDRRPSNKRLGCRPLACAASPFTASSAAEDSPDAAESAAAESVCLPAPMHEHAVREQEELAPIIEAASRPLEVARVPHQDRLEELPERFAEVLSEILEEFSLLPWKRSRRSRIRRGLPSDSA